MPAYGPPRRHRGRLPVVLLLVASLAAGAYLLLGRGGGSGSSGSQGFVATSQSLVDAAVAVPHDAQKVQRFLALHTFDEEAIQNLTVMHHALSQLQAIATQQSGSARQLADSTVAAGQQAIDAVTRFRQAVAFTYQLGSANAAQQDLAAALATIQHNIKAWGQ